jgi:hypothetical protein
MGSEFLTRDRIAGLDPGIHAAPNVIDVGIAQVRQRFGGNVASVAGLTVNHNVLIERRFNFPMARFDFAEIDIEVRAWNKASRMLLRRTDVDEDKALLRHRRRFGESRPQLLHGQQI